MRPGAGFRWYFAYGSNMNPARLFGERMVGNGIEHGRRLPASLPGWRLAFNKPWSRFDGAGAANIVRDAAAVVHGTINELPEAGFDVLDRYEGVAGGHYIRADVMVLDGEGQNTTAMTYVSRYRLTEGLKPACAYLAHLLAGRDLLPADYYEVLTKTPCISDIAEKPLIP
ncbi:MAG TPA: gamma-glutamylcyclotransferase [Rhabdaerophilum sp.]|nr:gamma-glutamylcyclotransferase [Rhabdaerophilum sp.]